MRKYSSTKDHEPRLDGDSRAVDSPHSNSHFFHSLKLQMRVVVVGAGAAGLVAAAEAASGGAEVVILEKSPKTGVKILMSGGTRCNVTHDTDARGITQEFGHAQRFLQPSIGSFPPSAVVQMFERAGVATKVESTGKVFPKSDRALHVRDALHRRAIESGVVMQTATAVQHIVRQADRWVVATPDAKIESDRLIVTSGGKSYPGCGTTGDAYGWLRLLGHTIVEPRPALVPLVGGSDWTRELSGLVVDDCVISAPTTAGGKRKAVTRRGAWLFTHFGFSGPAAMDISRVVTASDWNSRQPLFLDLLPELPESTLQQQLTDAASRSGKRRTGSLLADWLPSRLASALVKQLGADCTLAELPRDRRRKLVEHLKRLPVPVSGTRGFDKAEVTAGGVCLREVDPKTMASRKADGLFLAGEVLDVDGPIGGYNFQAAFSTGRAAGIAAAAP